MEYILTLWLFWHAPFDAVLVEKQAASCEIALESIIMETLADGVSAFKIVSCHLVLDT